MQNLFREFSPPNRRNGACLWQQTCCRKQSDENFMGQIITGDETWVYGHDPETKRQSSRSKVKVMLIAVHYEHVPQGQNINQQFYLQVLKRLRLAVSHNRPQKRAAGAWALHHDNAPAHTHTHTHTHTAHSIQEFLAKSWHSRRSTTILLP